MKRIAAPMVGGLATSFAMELLVYPAIYLLWKSGQHASSEWSGSTSLDPIGREPHHNLNDPRPGATVDPVRWSEWKGP
jgi:hypothetical protein